MKAGRLVAALFIYIAALILIPEERALSSEPEIYLDISPGYPEDYEVTAYYELGDGVSATIYIETNEVEDVEDWTINKGTYTGSGSVVDYVTDGGWYYRVRADYEYNGTTGTVYSNSVYYTYVESTITPAPTPTPYPDDIDKTDESDISISFSMKDNVGTIYYNIGGGTKTACYIYVREFDSDKKRTGVSYSSDNITSEGIYEFGSFSFEVKDGYYYEYRVPYVHINSAGYKILNEYISDYYYCNNGTTGPTPTPITPSPTPTPVLDKYECEAFIKIGTVEDNATVSYSLNPIRNCTVKSVMFYIQESPSLDGDYTNIYVADLGTFTGSSTFEFVMTPGMYYCAVLEIYLDVDGEVVRLNAFHSGVHISWEEVQYDLEYYSPVFDPEYYATNHADVVAKYGTDPQKLLYHFVKSGMSEGRRASEEFCVEIYKANYSDLRETFGGFLDRYYHHYISSGKAEGRIANRLLGTDPTPTPTPTPITEPEAYVYGDVQVEGNNVKAMYYFSGISSINGNAYLYYSIDGETYEVLERQSIVNMGSETITVAGVDACYYKLVLEYTCTNLSGEEETGTYETGVVYFEETIEINGSCTIMKDGMNIIVTAKVSGGIAGEAVIKIYRDSKVIYTNTWEGKECSFSVPLVPGSTYYAEVFYECRNENGEWFDKTMTSEVLVIGSGDDTDVYMTASCELALLPGRILSIKLTSEVFNGSQSLGLLYLYEDNVLVASWSAFDLDETYPAQEGKEYRMTYLLSAYSKENEFIQNTFDSNVIKVKKYIETGPELLDAMWNTLFDIEIPVPYTEFTFTPKQFIIYFLIAAVVIFLIWNVIDRRG